MPSQLFDLNIEEVLENWEVHHAIREIIGTRSLMWWQARFFEAAQARKLSFD